MHWHSSSPNSGVLWVAGKQPQLFIVTPDKKVVWEYDNFGQVHNLSTVQRLDVKLRMKKGVYFK